MKYKWLFLLVALLLAGLSLAACGGSANPTATPTAASLPPTQPFSLSVTTINFSVEGDWEIWIGAPEGGEWNGQMLFHSISDAGVPIPWTRDVPGDVIGLRFQGGEMGYIFVRDIGGQDMKVLLLTANGEILTPSGKPITLQQI